MIWYGLLFVLMVFAIFRMWRGQRYGESAPARRDAAFDPAEGHPQVRDALDMLKSGAWPQLTLLYGNLPASDRYHLVQGLGETVGNAPIAWPEEADSAILTIRAGLNVARVRKALSGGATGRAQARTMFATMMRDLEQAQSLLTEAAARNPHDSVTFAIQIQIETYANGGEHDVNAMIGKVDATEENNIFVAANHLQYMTPKWHGSIERMWRVANDYASNEPNAAWLAIAARAHIEEWLYCMKIDTSLTAGYVAQLQDSGFANHVRGMDRQFWERAARGGMTRAEAHFAHNQFAFLLQMLRLDDLIGRHLDAIGPFIANQPWNYLPAGAERPTQLLAELRRKAGLPTLT